MDYFCTAARIVVSFGIISAIAGQERSVFGIYGQAKAGHDSVQVVKKANDQIGVSVKLYYANGHTCQLTQDGKWSNDHVAVIAEGLDANHSCRLNLFFKNGRVLLQDEGLQCAPVYCGTRGKLDSVSLQKVR